MKLKKNNNKMEKWHCKIDDTYDDVVTSHDFILLKIYVFNLQTFSSKSTI